ncbi:MAG: hypothetical protein RSA67_05345, partial [Alistipes sp.]
MKRTIFFGFMLSVIAMTFNACAKDETEEVAVIGQYSINATAEPQEEPTSSETRTALDGAQVKWSTGDKIMVVRKDHSETAEYTLSSPPGSQATFVSNTPLPAGTTSCGLYPYDPRTTYTDNVFRFTLPTQQTYAKGTFGNGANPMVAQSDEKGVLQFSNLCGVIKFQLRGDEKVGSIKLTTVGEKVSGPVSVDTKTADRLLVMEGATEPAMQEVTLLGINMQLSPDIPTAFYFVVPAQTYAAGLKFTAYDEKGDEITYKQTTKPLTVNRSRVLPLAPKKLWYFPDANFRLVHLPIFFSASLIIRLPNGDIDMDDPRNKPLAEAMAKKTSMRLEVGNGQVQTLKGIEYFPALTTLDCNNMQLKELDITQNKLLVTLYCQTNQLTHLDLSNNTNLQTLHCGENQLTTLDLSSTPNLKKLGCHKNRLSELTITYLPALEQAYCGTHTTNGTTPLRMALFLTEAQFKNQNIASGEYMQGGYPELNQDIDKQVLNFPDPTFREILVKKYGMVLLGDDIDVRSQSNIDKFNGLKELNLDAVEGGTERKIKTLAGIEHFNALETLSVQYHEMTALNLNKNTRLTKLNVNGNNLLKLDFELCSQVWKLDCRNNRLRELKFPVSSALTTLDCSNNQLNIPISFQNATKLMELHCGNNNMHSLDISPCKGIKILSCERNLLTRIGGLAALSLLQDFDCSENQLTSLLLNNHPNLSYLKCTGNPLSGGLSFAGGPNSPRQLVTLYCAYCNLTTLDLNALQAECPLHILDCSHNQLTKLDLTKFYKEYSWLNLSHNLLTGFDLLPSTVTTTDMLPNLKYIDISNNKMNMNNENLFDWRNWESSVHVNPSGGDFPDGKDRKIAKRGYYFMRMPNLETLRCHENDKIKRIFIGEKAPKLTKLLCGLQHLTPTGYPYQNETTQCYVKKEVGLASMFAEWPYMWPENTHVGNQYWTTGEGIVPFDYVE